VCIVASMMLHMSLVWLSRSASLLLPAGPAINKARDQDGNKTRDISWPARY
jgi:hypothetical protein